LWWVESHSGVHTPAEQLVELAPAREQTRLHWLQWPASFCRSLQVLPLQTVKLLLQLRTQDFDGQDQLEPLAGTAPHPVPQAVQLVALEVVSQPSLLVALVLQLWCVESHTGVQT